MALLQLKSNPFHRFGSRYSSLFGSDHFLGRNALDDSRPTNAPANIEHNEKELLVEIPLPGFSVNEIQIFINKNEIEVSAERTAKSEAYQIEEIPNKVSRFFQLSPAMDKDNIEANLFKGVLRLTIPYTEKTSKSSNKIAIR